MNEKYKMALITLWGYCGSKGQWVVGFDDPPYERLVNIARKVYGDSWGYETFDNIVHHHLQSLKSARLSGGDAQRIIDEIAAVLAANMQQVFLVVPLKGAWIEASVQVGDLTFVRTTVDHWGLAPASLPRVDIIKELAATTAFSKERIEGVISAITRARAPDFLSCPLLVIRRYGLYEVIGSMDYGHFILKYINIFLRVLASHYGVKPGMTYLGFTRADHYFSFDESKNYNHYPLREVIQLNYDLNFLQKASAQEMLNEMFSMFENRNWSDLLQMYFRSMKFYNFGLRGSEFSLDDVSQRLLNTLIAAETLLSFSTRGEKKSKLAHIMVGLAEVLPEEREQCYKGVIEAYKDRSSLVHSGTQDVAKYIIDLQTDQRESESLTLLSKLMVHILVKFPTWYQELTTGVRPDEYLLKWQAKIRAFIPPNNYNWLQRMVSRLIVFLQKIARLRPE